MSRARTLANLGAVTSSATELNLMDGQTDIASQAELDVVSTTVTANKSEVDTVKTNQAILAFRQAVDHSDVKYNLQDQIVDEYVDATGVNTGDSTNEILASGAYGSSASATGGTITTTGSYNVHTFLLAQTGNSFTPSATMNVDYLVVAGGGAGGAVYSGAGGAGGFRTDDAYSLAGGAHTITVGAGGAAGAADLGASGDGGSGGASSIAALIVSAGGGGGGTGNRDGLDGGSGGGGGGADPSNPGGDATPVTSPVQGYAGGANVQATAQYRGGGGGGAGAVGVDGGAGGVGSKVIMGLSVADTTTLLANASAGVVESSDSNYRYLAGGGGGGAYVTGGGAAGAGGLGGGGGGSNSTVGAAGTAGTGSGGGGSGVGAVGGVGGSGIVMIRYIPAFNDIILQSSDTTAEAAPTKADMVMLIEDAGSGVGTVNTHIKGWVSRYETGGTKTWTEGVLVDEGDWGTDKRILAFHDLTLTGTGGTQMAYKITTHSQSAVYDTKIHATSIGWR